MKPLLDAFWRAAAYCLHPRVIVLSLLPLVLMVGGWRSASATSSGSAAIDAVRAHARSAGR